MQLNHKENTEKRGYKTNKQRNELAYIYLHPELQR